MCAVVFLKSLHPIETLTIHIHSHKKCTKYFSNKFQMLMHHEMISTVFFLPPLKILTYKTTIATKFAVQNICLKKKTKIVFFRVDFRLMTMTVKTNRQPNQLTVVRRKKMSSQFAFIWRTPKLQCCMYWFLNTSYNLNTTPYDNWIG